MRFNSAMSATKEIGAAGADRNKYKASGMGRENKAVKTTGEARRELAAGHFTSDKEKKSKLRLPAKQKKKAVRCVLTRP